jgi:hypothetical protein
MPKNNISDNDKRGYALSQQDASPRCRQTSAQDGIVAPGPRVGIEANNRYNQWCSKHENDAGGISGNAVPKHNWISMSSTNKTTGKDSSNFTGLKSRAPSIMKVHSIMVNVNMSATSTDGTR